MRIHCQICGRCRKALPLTRSIFECFESTCMSSMLYDCHRLHQLNSYSHAVYAHINRMIERQSLIHWIANAHLWWITYIPVELIIKPRPSLILINLQWLIYFNAIVNLLFSGKLLACRIYCRESRQCLKLSTNTIVNVNITKWRNALDHDKIFGAKAL